VASAFVRASNGTRRRAPGFSSTTWVLMPPKPMAVMPARTGVPLGQASAVRSTRRLRGSCVNTSCGSTQPIAGGSTSWWTAMAALISPAMPAAALVCPIIPLIEVTAAGPADVPASALASDSAVSSVLSPTCVPVPWPSNRPTVSMPKPARSYARRSASLYPLTSGRVMPPRPSDEMPQPATVA
jgi:hypothetical protein